MTETFATGIQMGESPRWHDGRFWMCDWLAGEVLVFDARGQPRGGGARRGPALLDRLAAGRPARRHHAGRGDGRSGPGAVRRPRPALQRDRRRCRRPGVGGHAGLDAVGGAQARHADRGASRRQQPPGRRRCVVPERHGRPRRRHPRARRVACRPADGVDDHRVGRSGGPPVWADLGPGSAPDGICADASGAIWYASVPGQCCKRVAEGGEVLERVNADRGCFACMLGGDDGRTLYIVANNYGEGGASDGVVLTHRESPFPTPAGREAVARLGAPESNIRLVVERRGVANGDEQAVGAQQPGGDLDPTARCAPGESADGRCQPARRLLRRRLRPRTRCWPAEPGCLAGHSAVPKQAVGRL